MKVILSLYGVVLALLLLAGAGGVARLLFPATVVVLGILVFFRAREYYMDLVLWCWFLSPFLRRVMDYQAGWKDPSVILLVPYLVALVAPACSWKRLLSVPLRSVLPFAAALVALAYGVVVGLALQSIAAIAAALLTWVAPILFAWWYATAEGQDQAHVARSVERSFMGGVLAMGLYGCIQFALVPAWDRNWLVQLGANADVTSMGAPEPFEIRVFSTMNSAGVFALIAASGLIFLTTVKSWWAVVAIASGFASLVLTQGRSAWLCLIVGLVLLSFRAPKGVVRTLLVVAMAAFLFLPILLVGPARDMLQTRLSSMTTMSSDDSANARKQGSAGALNALLEHPAGLGLGVKEDVIANDGSFALHDNGIIEAFITLGWLGGTIYLASLVALAFPKSSSGGSNASFRSTSRIIAIALLSQTPLGSVFLGAPGFFLWLFLACAASEVEAPVPVTERVLGVVQIGRLNPVLTSNFPR